MDIYYSVQFRNAYKKLPVGIKNKAEEKEGLFRKDPFDPRLETHKLHGRLKKQWSFSIDRKYRILFEFDKPVVIFLDVGDHDVYQ